VCDTMSDASETIQAAMGTGECSAFAFANE
jgi:hypothetical protein